MAEENNTPVVDTAEGDKPDMAVKPTVQETVVETKETVDNAGQGAFDSLDSEVQKARLETVDPGKIIGDPLAQGTDAFMPGVTKEPVGDVIVNDRLGGAVLIEGATASPMIDTAGHATSAHGAHSETLANTTTIPFTTITLPYPIYTVVFGTLAVITILEVLIAEIFSRDFFLTVPLLVVLSLGKAVLVVLYYMHLKEDSRLFAIALGLPLFIAAVATLFLLSVPTTGYP